MTVASRMDENPTPANRILKFLVMSPVLLERPKEETWNKFSSSGDRARVSWLNVNGSRLNDR
jgi:hypothetical protein